MLEPRTELEWNWLVVKALIVLWGVYMITSVAVMIQ